MLPRNKIAHRKIREDGTFIEQSIKEHLTNTAVLAAQFSDVFNCKDWGYYCGERHDLGKYSEAFQKRIWDDGPKVDHSTAGAKESKIQIIQAIVAGHHSGLMDSGNASDVPGTKTLCGRLKKKIPEYNDYTKEIILHDQLSKPNIIATEGLKTYHVSFFTRMLYSALVDADFLDTEAFMNNEQIKRSDFEDWSVLYNRIQEQTTKYLQAKKTNEINQKRNHILQDCITKGQNEKRGLFTLTVPTGGGKTIASLAFAAEQIKNLGLNRVIYVIPYTSIIDQTVKVFQEILGEKNVLAHHSMVNYDDESELSTNEITMKKLATENWDAPVIVTTNVQFFESLYGNKSSQCRKLHHIANSIIIFDEAQMLPYDYLRPCVQSIAELIKNYRCSAVLCTATQPALSPFFPKEMRAKEICSDVPDLYEFFRRVTYKNIGEINKETLAEKIRTAKQVLCIVNSRKQASLLFEELGSEQNFHLSTLMYPMHRKQILREIRKKLKSGSPCRVISTSLIEAGVDLDFPIVYRAVTGLDSIIQAGGRCNREGKHPQNKSTVNIFELIDAGNMPRQLKQYIAVTNMVIRQFEQLDDLEAIKLYFNELYNLKDTGLDAKNILERIGNTNTFPFESVSKDFSLIENNMKTIYIANDEAAEKLLEQYRYRGPNRQLLREMGQYSVSVYENQYQTLRDHGRLESLDESLSLLNGSEYYSKEVGLKIPEEKLGVGLFE